MSRERLKYVRLVVELRRRGGCSSVKLCLMILQVSKSTLISLGVILAALITFESDRHLLPWSLFFHIFSTTKKKNQKFWLLVLSPECLYVPISAGCFFVCLFVSFYQTKLHYAFRVDKYKSVYI